MPDFAWRPTPQYVERANVSRLMRAHGIEDYDELVRRSQEDIAWFWDAVVADLDIEFFSPYRSVVETPNGIPWAIWFAGGKINAAHNTVDKQADVRPDATAIVWEGEDEEVRRLTYAEMREAVDRLANGLASLGIGAGDTVGVYLPMVPENPVPLITPISSKMGRGHVASMLHAPPARRTPTVTCLPAPR